MSAALVNRSRDALSELTKQCAPRRRPIHGQSCGARRVIYGGLSASWCDFLTLGSAPWD